MNNKDSENARDKVNDNYQKLTYVNNSKRLSWFKKRRYK